MAISRSWPAVLLLVAVAGCTQAPVAQAPTVPPSTVASAPASSAPPSSSPASIVSPTSKPVVKPKPILSRPAATATPAAVAPVSAQARAAGLVDIRTIVPDAILDLRYATSNNFVGVRLYPTDARCLVHESMAPGLVTAAALLRRQGYRLVFWDCYRPHAVQVHMFQVVPNPNWVARPGEYATSHEAARSVDVTLARSAAGAQCAAAQRDHGHCLLEMGTGFDDFTARAYAFATDGVSTLARSNRTLLRRAMNAGGLAVYSGEWWHFDGPGSLLGRPQLDVPVD